MMLKKIILTCVLTSLSSLALAQSQGIRSSKIFSQDSEYIYRTIPESIDVTDRDLMFKLLEAGTLESLKQTKLILNKLEVNTFDSALKEVEAEIDSYLRIDEQLELLNKQVGSFADSHSNEGLDFKDFMPKSITVYAGLGGSIASLISLSGALTPGYTLMLDRVDRVRKSDLAGFSKNTELELSDIKNAFSSIEAGAEESTLRLLTVGKKRQIKDAQGNTITVDSYIEIDAAPVIIASPAIGVGVGGGTAFRVGVMASWWKGNNILEPEDHYGWGMAYSQDMAALSGFNFKLGYINSDTASGYLDIYFASIGFIIGAEVVATPAKANVMIIKDPAWILKKMGIEQKAEKWLEGALEESKRAEWEKLSDMRKKIMNDNAPKN